MPRPPTVIAPQATGANSYGLLAVHANNSDIPTQNDYLGKRYSFITNGLEPSSEGTDFPRASGTRGQTAIATGQSRVGGDVAIALGETHVGTWLKQWLYDLSPTVTTVASVAVAAAGSYTSGTAITVADEKQPFTLITNPLVDCGQLKFTFAGATGAGSIDVVGEDENGTPVKETITFTTANGTHNSKHYYSKVTSYTPRGAVSGGTLKLDCDPGVYSKVLIPGAITPPGLLMELVKGGVVNTFDFLRVASGQIDFGDNLGLTLSLQGRQAYLNQNIAGGTDPTSVSGKTIDGSDVAVAWGSYVKLNDVVIAHESVGISLNQNLQESPFGNYNSIYPPPPIPGGNRIIEANAVIPYGSDFRQFEDLVVGGDVKAQFHFAIKGFGRRHASFTFDFAQCKLRGFPSSPINDLGPIRQTLNLAPYYVSDTKPDIKLTVITHENETAFI